MKKDPLKISGMHAGATPNVFRNAQKLRAESTEPEKKLWNYIKTKPKGYKFRRQHPIAGYILDFYCHKIRLSIEIDGEYHLTKEQKLRDNERTEYLKTLGITEIRFTNQQVTESFIMVITSIKTYLSVDIPLGIEDERKGKIDTYD